MKKIIIALLLISLTGCSSSVQLGTDKVVDEEKEKIKSFEKLYKEAVGKYKHVKKYEKDSSKYMVNEYETPSGETGYQIIKDDGINLESVCVGVECDGKDFTTTPIAEDEITATSTSK